MIARMGWVQNDIFPCHCLHLLPIENRGYYTKCCSSSGPSLLVLPLLLVAVGHGVAVLERADHVTEAPEAHENSHVDCSPFHWDGCGGVIVGEVASIALVGHASHLSEASGCPQAEEGVRHNRHFCLL